MVSGVRCQVSGVKYQVMPGGMRPHLSVSSNGGHGVGGQPGQVRHPHLGIQVEGTGGGAEEEEVEEEEKRE